MKFAQWGKKLKVPFVIYADFECILSPLPKEGGKIHMHKPCGYSYLIVSAVDEEQHEIVCTEEKMEKMWWNTSLTVCLKNQSTWYNV